MAITIISNTTPPTVAPTTNEMLEGVDSVKIQPNWVFWDCMSASPFLQLKKGLRVLHPYKI